MIHIGTKEIETDRLILRKFIKSDIKFAFKNWCSDDKVTKHLSWPTHSDISVTESVFNDWIKSYEKDDFYLWAIVLKETNEPIGSITLVDINEKENSAEIGYCIGFNWWNKGIVSEAFSSIIPFLFEEIKLNKIDARHDPENHNSGKVMIKCGLKFEKTLKQNSNNNQGLVDDHCYGLLSDDYFKMLK
ncbi:MAG: GNAT family N-acetyltransferase [Mycoplasmatales bacterium]